MQDADVLKETLKKYKKENYHVMTWEEYEVELKSLTRKAFVLSEKLMLKIFYKSTFRLDPGLF